MSEQIKKVLCNVQQSLSNPEKAQARANIDAVSSSELADSLATKQDTLTAGDNINISEQNEISATDTTYSAGSGLSLNGTQFSVDTSVIQPKLTAGQNVQINDNVISATDTTYSAGANVQISSSNEISATDTTYSAGSGLSLNGTQFSVDTATIQSKLTAGQNVSIGDVGGVLTISATDTTYSAGTGLALNGTTFSNSAPNVKSDWNAAAGTAGEILNKPAIPTVNDGTLTIQRNGTQVATFSANQSGDVTANISVPTDTGDLTNGAGFITSADIPSTDDIVLVSVNASTPYDDVAAAFLANKTPVLYYAYQNSLLYYWFTSKTASSYTFAAVNKGNFGNVVSEYIVNSDNTVSNSSQTSAKRFSVNDETLTIDNGELKWRYPATTCFGSATSNGGSVDWIPTMTSSQFNRKLVSMPLPAAGIYLVQYTGTGRFVDTLTDTGSPGLLFRVCIGDQTQSFSMFAGNWQFADSSSTSPYTGFSGFTIANIPSNYISDVSLNISNNDYAPLSGQTQTFSWTSLRAAWFRLPQ